MSAPTSYPTPCEFAGYDAEKRCNAPSVYRYEAMGGGWFHLCAVHGAKHADYSEHVTNGPGRGLVIGREQEAAKQAARLAGVPDRPPSRRSGPPRRIVVDLATVEGVEREIARASRIHGVERYRYVQALEALRDALATVEGDGRGPRDGA